ncbi:Oidioi.mRNA.OKI2018_I69.XSR.g14805.t1.cds [Oikopleura dioica]|uniref:Oidioi.mRNA.OKI2018_I69.XSR.g14805.t1.cds n=1 Tax=Oikopleura dioica TaxID=34765 RepID=A0ABN7SAU8_OIKDI|nr:Oidioi.mRNA.OKI2018_I69.XSR.g14805.t1.cds [Oikopleura dioica]
MSRKRKFSEANRSPPKQPLSLKAIATLSVKELILEALDDDPAAVGHIKVDHVFSTEFNIYRILLPDGTPTPYVFCDHPSCLDKPNRDKIFLGMGGRVTSDKAVTSLIRSHEKTHLNLERLGRLLAEICVELNLDPSYWWRLPTMGFSVVQLLGASHGFNIHDIHEDIQKYMTSHLERVGMEWDEEERQFIELVTEHEDMDYDEPGM